MAKKKETGLNFTRIGEEIDVLLTEIYGRYVAQGSPTKLGGLRFLDVPSARTFALERTRATDDGNMLIISAPFEGNQQVIEKALKKGPHSKLLHEVIMRTSTDAGKSGKYFVEPAYTLSTGEWLSDEEISKVAENHGCNGNEAVRIILKREVLPIASEVLEHFVQAVREHSADATIRV
ncbi:MAG: hypothetical protein KC910_07880 [Candidatus Eremiobacteraeota bacterium]|nr:hypothetical protein [Candidatus Eremiobacteraeota bacterium]